VQFNFVKHTKKGVKLWVTGCEFKVST